MDVLIFKTDVTSKRKATKVSTLLTTFPTIQQWNFDLEDCDKILRIVANGLSPRNVETVLRGVGIGCEELEY
jgi:hypothetical protein